MAKVIFEKEYHGFEDIYDTQRDIIECFDPYFNDNLKDIPVEFQGTMKITITYEEYNGDNVKG